MLLVVLGVIAAIVVRVVRAPGKSVPRVQDVLVSAEQPAMSLLHSCTTTGWQRHTAAIGGCNESVTEHRNNSNA